MNIWQRYPARREKEREMVHLLTAAIAYLHYYENPGFVQVCAVFQAAMGLRGNSPVLSLIGWV